MVWLNQAGSTIDSCLPYTDVDFLRITSALQVSQTSRGGGECNQVLNQAEKKCLEFLQDTIWLRTEHRNKPAHMTRQPTN